MPKTKNDVKGSRRISHMANGLVVQLYGNIGGTSSTVVSYWGIVHWLMIFTSLYMGCGGKGSDCQNHVTNQGLGPASWSHIPRRRKVATSEKTQH